MIIETRPVGGFAMNTYVVACRETRAAAVIDSGGDLAWIQQVVAEHGLEVKLLLQTHAHIDHIAGLGETKAAWPDAPIVMHADDMEIYEAAPMMAMMFGLRLGGLPDIDRHIADGEVVELGTLRFEIMHVPGHCPGQVAFVEKTHGVAISGDLLFAGSIGRTDLPGCNVDDMKRSLERFTTTLPATMRVLSGHGPETTVGRELASNPFLRPGSW